MRRHLFILRKGFKKVSYYGACTAMSKVVSKHVVAWKRISFPRCGKVFVLFLNATHLSIHAGFTLNIENVEAMAGIRLFPCWSDSGSSKKDSIVLYFGISDYYLSLYVPYRSSAHMLELKMLRRLCDLRRLSFRKKDPNLMTLEFAQRGKTETEPISIKVLDGRKEIVSMISSLKN